MAGLILATTSITGAHSAAAHATLDKSSPPDGTTLDHAPSEVWAEFTEPVAPSSTLRITDHCGRVSDDGTVEIAVTRMTVGMTASSPSQYTVTWRTTSMVDGHTATGYWTFTVSGARTACDTAKTPPAEAATPPSTPTAGSAAAPAASAASADGRPAAATSSVSSLPGIEHASDHTGHGEPAAPAEVDPHALHGTGAPSRVVAGVELPAPTDQGSGRWLLVALPVVLAAGLAPRLVGARTHPS